MHPFVRIMQRYIEDYCNCHDPSVCEEIMAPEYVVHIAGRDLAGRDERYIPAASAAFASFPDLRLTVHELHTNGDRLAMRFSEHGTSRATGRAAAWGGIGLYDWNGEALVTNWVEQDYAARQRQVDGASGRDPVEQAHPGPWSVTPVASSEEAEAVAYRFLRAADLTAAPEVAIDDSWLIGPASIPMTPGRVDIDDLFSVGDVVAAHVTLVEARRRLHASVLLRVEGGRVVAVRAVTDRLAMAERAEG